MHTHTHVHTYTHMPREGNRMFWLNLFYMCVDTGQRIDENKSLATAKQLFFEVVWRFQEIRMPDVGS